MIYFIITTSLIERDWNIRKNQYKLAIFSLLTFLQPHVFPKDKSNKTVEVVIVENQLANVTEKPASFLDEFGVPVLYTKTNSLPTQNKGLKEWEDIQCCIRHFNIKDDDFIVKMTGRYIVINHDTNIEQNGIGNFVRDIGNLLVLYRERFGHISNNEIGNVFQKSNAFYHNQLEFKPYFLTFLIQNCYTNNCDCIIRYGSYNDEVSTNPIKDCVTGLIGMRCKYIKQISRPKENECVEHLWANMSLNIPIEKVKRLDKLGIYICPASNSYFLV